MDMQKRGESEVQKGGGCENTRFKMAGEIYDEIWKGILGKD